MWKKTYRGNKFWNHRKYYFVQRECENPDIVNFQESEIKDCGGSENLEELETDESSSSSLKYSIKKYLKKNGHQQ